MVLTTWTFVFIVVLLVSCASSSDHYLSAKAFMMLSHNLRFGLPSTHQYLHRHHSLAHIFFFSSQYIPMPLQPTFLYFLGYFSHLRCSCNSVNPYYVQLGSSTHPSQHRHVRYIQLLLLGFLHCPSVGNVHQTLSYNRLVYFPLSLKLILRSHITPDTLFQFFHPDCVICVIFTSMSPFSAITESRY